MSSVERRDENYRKVERKFSRGIEHTCPLELRALTLCFSDGNFFVSAFLFDVQCQGFAGGHPLFLLSSLSLYRRFQRRLKIQRFDDGNNINNGTEFTAFFPSGRPNKIDGDGVRGRQWDFTTMQ